MPHYQRAARLGLSGALLASLATAWWAWPATWCSSPELFVDWLRRPDVLRYLRDLWLSSGGLAILHPLSLAMAAAAARHQCTSPAMTGCGRVGGTIRRAIVPFLVIAAAYGVGLAGLAGQQAADTQAE